MSKARKTAKDVAREKKTDKAYRESVAEFNAKRIYEDGKKWAVPFHKITDAIEQRVSYIDFKEQAFIDKCKERKETASARYVPQFNLSRFLLAKATGEKLGHAEEMCVSAAREDFGKTKDGGTYLPNRCFSPPLKAGQRDLTADTPSAGGYTIADELLPIIEAITPEAPILNLVSRIDAKSGFAIPRQDTKPIAEWVSEVGQATEQQIVFSQETLTPRPIRCWSSYTIELLQQSSVSVERLVRQDLKTAIDTSIESSMLNLSNPAKGLLFNTSVPNLTHIGGQITPDNCLAAEAAVLQSNAVRQNPRGNLISGESLGQPSSLSWLVAPFARRLLKQTPELLGGNLPLWQSGDEDNPPVTTAGGGTKRQPTCIGYDGFVSSHFPANSQDAILANWEDILLVKFAATSIILDPYSLSTSGQIRMTATSTADWGIRHTDSIIRLHN